MWYTILAIRRSKEKKSNVTHTILWVENLDTTKRNAFEFHLVPEAFYDHIHNFRAIQRHLGSITPGAVSVSNLVLMFLALFLKFGC